jgi:LDH2 family malate/lactate/ureidoglycolate dehydrogenase
MAHRYSSDALKQSAEQMLSKSGLAQDRAVTVAEILVEGDLLGHTTHGLQLLPAYLKDLEKGEMTKEGDLAVIADHGHLITWDANYLPGPWVIVTAIERMMVRIPKHGMVTSVIRKAHHIACLAAYLKRVTDQGYMIILYCSDPHVYSVAPFGGIAGRYTPNPIAAAWPTKGDPILIDISASTTTNGMVNRARRLGEKLPHAWLIDNQGHPTHDPEALFTEPPGGILPLGGMELGHKGYALGLIVEAMTNALGGHGRADGANRWTGNTHIQIIDPQAFAGRDEFIRETTWLAESCKTTPVKKGNPPVRLPGQRALEMRTQQLHEGIGLHPEIMPALKIWADKLKIALPDPL